MAKTHDAAVVRRALEQMRKVTGVFPKLLTHDGNARVSIPQPIRSSPVTAGGMRADWYSNAGHFRTAEFNIAGQQQKLNVYYGRLGKHQKLVFARGDQPKLELNVSRAVKRAPRLLLVRMSLSVSEGRGINKQALSKRTNELVKTANLKKVGANVIVGQLDASGLILPSPKKVVHAAIKCLAIKESLRSALNRGEFLVEQKYADFGHPPNDDPSELQAFARKVRRGQAQLRRSLLHAYGNRCAITGVSPKHVLEAAHIIPHAEKGLNSLRNALLLRSDIHVLFDRGLIRIHPHTLEVRIAPSLKKTLYSQFNGYRVVVPKKVRPNPKFLLQHWKKKPSNNSEY